MIKTASKQGVGAREAGRQLGVSHSYLLRLAKENRLPRHGDGTFDVAECRRVLARTTDPAQVRAGTIDKWSQPVRSAGGDQSIANAASRCPGIAADLRPDPASYRTRTDLPDDFARGALYGAHAVAYQVPHEAAYSVMDQGGTHAQQIAAYKAERDAVFLLVKDPMSALGVEDRESDEPTALSPTAFMGFTVGGGTG